MDTTRLFIALTIEKAYTKKIFKQFESLDLPWEKIRKVNDEQLHLTLKFLGPTKIDKVPTIIDVLEGIKITAEEIALSLDAPMIFNERTPKVLSLSFKQNADLQKLYEQIDKGLFDAQIANMEVRRFRPHLTLARVKKAASFDEFEEFLKWQPQKDFLLYNFELMESVASKKGPIYNSLQSFEL